MCRVDEDIVLIHLTNAILDHLAALGFLVPLVHELLQELAILLSLLTHCAHIRSAQTVVLSHLPLELMLYEYLVDYVNLFLNT